MYEILNEDQYNDTYGRYRMFAALKLKHQDDPDFHIPGERTIYRMMEAVGLIHRPIDVILKALQRLIEMLKSLMIS